MSIDALLDVWKQVRPLGNCPRNPVFSSARHPSSELTVDNTVLKDVRLDCGMEVAFVTEFDKKVRHFRHVDAEPEFNPLKVGDRVALSEGYCQKVVDGRLPEMIPDTHLVPEALSIRETRSLPIGSHISVPIRLSQGELFGTLCCFSRTSKPSLSAGHLQTLRYLSMLLGNWIRWEGRHLGAHTYDTLPDCFDGQHPTPDWPDKHLSRKTAHFH